MARFDDTDPDDVEIIPGDDEQQGRAETDAGAARQNDDEGDDKGGRRGSANRVGYLLRRMQRLERDNEALRRDSEARDQLQKHGQVSRTIDEAAQTISGRLNANKAALKEALASGDADKAAELQIEIGQLAVRQARLQDHAEDLKRSNSRQPPADPGGSAPAHPEHLVNWTAENSDWFSMDERAEPHQREMTIFALQAEKYLAEKHKLAPGTPESLAKIQDAVEEKFPGYFGRQAKAARAKPGTIEVEVAPEQPAVREPPAGASRFAPPSAGGTSAPSPNGKVRLTREQADFAKRNNIPVAEYARAVASGD